MQPHKTQLEYYSVSLVSLTKNHMKKATLISKWLQQDTLIKISLGYGWILSVYSLMKKTKSAKQKKTHNFREQNFFLKYPD